MRNGISCDPREKSGVPPDTVCDAELRAYSSISQGDRERTKKEIEALLEIKSKGCALSVDAVDEARYRGVEIINLAARCAARNGANEAFCLELADEATTTMDKIPDVGEIRGYISEKCGELTDVTAEAVSNGDYPYAVKKAIGYISANLDKPLTVSEIADVCGISPDYLSYQFRRATGERMTAYIRKKKLLAARELLRKQGRCSEIAKRLSFCSESYFVKCFREEFGITPKKYKNSC